MKLTCRCGEVELEVHGDPIAQFYCHCDDCQLVHGGAYAPESLHPADAVQVVRGNPTCWKLKRTPRWTCPTCGTRLFSDVETVNLRGLNGYMLPKGQFRPAFHMQCQYAVVPVRDALPHYKSMPASFGGSDETVDW